MLNIKITYSRTEGGGRVLATRMSLLQVLECLAEAYRGQGNYLRFHGFMDAFFVNDAEQANIVIRATKPQMEASDIVELHLLHNGDVERYRLSEIADRIPICPPVVTDSDLEIEEKARDWAIDYKPWQYDLEPKAYAESGFNAGAKWMRNKIEEDGERTREASIGENLSPQDMNRMGLDRGR